MVGADEGSTAFAVQTQVGITTKYLVGGDLRETVKQVSEAVSKTRDLSRKLSSSRLSALSMRLNSLTPKFSTTSRFCFSTWGICRAPCWWETKVSLCLCAALITAGKT